MPLSLVERLHPRLHGLLSLLITLVTYLSLCPFCCSGIVTDKSSQIKCESFDHTSVDHSNNVVAVGCVFQLNIKSGADGGSQAVNLMKPFDLKRPKVK